MKSLILPKRFVKNVFVHEKVPEKLFLFLVLIYCIVIHFYIK